MTSLFKNRANFSLMFFAILVVDVLFISSPELKVLRIISKPLIILSLFFFYYLNHQKLSGNNYWFMIFALSFFLLGDLLLLYWENNYLFTLGMMSFVLAKIGYMLRFSHQRDFKLVRLLPFFNFLFCLHFVYYEFNV